MCAVVVVCLRSAVSFSVCGPQTFLEPSEDLRAVHSATFDHVVPPTSVPILGINGFGHVGRLIFRAAAGNPDVAVKAINDPSAPQRSAAARLASGLAQVRGPAANGRAALLPQAGRSHTKLLSRLALPALPISTMAYSIILAGKFLGLRKRRDEFQFPGMGGRPRALKLGLLNGRSGVALRPTSLSATARSSSSAPLPSGTESPPGLELRPLRLAGTIATKEADGKESGACSSRPVS